MRIFKDLYLAKKNISNTAFYALYSNNTFISGDLKCRKDTDGSDINDLILNKDSLIQGEYRMTDEGLEIKNKNDVEWIVWKENTNDSYKFSDQEILKFSDNLIIEKFLIQNQEVLLDIEPVNHDYVRLECKHNLKKDFFVINWFLGNTCSYSCSYCPSYLNNGSIPWMDIKILKKFIDKLFNYITDRVIIIEFTGGEVTLYKDYPELCSYIKSKGGRISMISNGSRTMDWWRKNVHNFDQITLSYHTEHADRAHYLELVNLLKDNVDLSANIMAPPGTLDFCLDLAIDAKNLKDSAVHLMPIIEDLEGELLEEYTKEELQIIDNFNSRSLEYSTHTKTNWFHFRGAMYKVYQNGKRLPISPPALVSNKENTWLGWDCYSGISQIIINADGDIYRGWCFVGGKIGNIANPNLVFPDKPVLCNKPLCHCNFDAFSVKERTKVVL